MQIFFLILIARKIRKGFVYYNVSYHVIHAIRKTFHLYDVAKY